MAPRGAPPKPLRRSAGYFPGEFHTHQVQEHPWDLHAFPATSSPEVVGWNLSKSSFDRIEVLRLVAARAWVRVHLDEVVSCRPGTERYLRQRGMLRQGSKESAADRLPSSKQAGGTLAFAKPLLALRALVLSEGGSSRTKGKRGVSMPAGFGVTMAPGTPSTSSSTLLPITKVALLLSSLSLFLLLLLPERTGSASDENADLAAFDEDRDGAFDTLGEPFFGDFGVADPLVKRP
eukprot:CAMPEP_0206529350 /NCGR_PEP_ID=MMETSP0325_2-20121206/2547_1 /ASSEMBLY_ACC=CAM_ASM_000347 /TAXON_ID=2866 /ORGANISM="Crypthecodinium cohnii, Strain Seligo" /LENGTH=233 /DNA_ID=CAMNT_0054025245 /DNA_START=461 /DNA_END=1164 /DNA_ORIENTATION=-